MTKKFYQNSEFRELQTEWYDKLKEEGFDDLEWFDPKTGMGLGTPYLKNSTSITPGELCRKYHPELDNHYRLCRNFLAHGPFYPNLEEKYRNSSSLQDKYKSFGLFLGKSRPYFSRALSELFKMYTEGRTIRQISTELRKLHKSKQLGKPPKHKGKYSKAEPYSIYWVHSHLKSMKLAMIEWNTTAEEGINAWQAEEVDEFDPSLNRPVGSGEF